VNVRVSLTALGAQLKQKFYYEKLGLGKCVSPSEGGVIFFQKVHTIQSTLECDLEFELSHLRDLRDSVGRLPGVVEDFQLGPLCNSVTTLPDAWCYPLWGRIKSYSELPLLHILGFSIEIMNGFR